MEIMNEQKSAGTLFVGEPEHYGLCKIVIFNIIASLMGAILGALIVLAPVAILGGLFSGSPAMFKVGCICQVINLTILFFLPVLAGGNPYIVHLVKKIPQQPEWNEKPFVVQMSLSPRLHFGIRGVLEDADDIGFLSFTKDSVIFYGDQTRLELPIDSLTEVSVRNVGFRGLWICGNRIRVRSKVLCDYEFVEFADRSAWNVISAFRRSKEILAVLRQDGKTNMVRNLPAG